MDRLRSLDRGVIGSSSLCGGSFVAVFTFFSFSSEDLEKLEVFPLSGERRIKLSLKKSLTQMKLFLKERIKPVKVARDSCDVTHSL